MGLLGVAWSNIIVGVAAALVVGGLVQAKDYTYNKYLEYKFPISGEYITTFEDEKEGETVVATAPATLEQKGRKIEGTTIMPGDDREWKLEGEIAEGGYMNGVYYAIDPHDQGIGNFFLYVNYDRHMEGLWSGYDEVNEKINSGRYTFTPVLDSYDTRRLTAERIPATVDIADNRLGRDYLSADSLETSLKEDSPYFTRLAVMESRFSKESSIADKLAHRFLNRGEPIVRGKMVPTETNTEEVIGFCLGALFDQDQLNEYLNIDQDDFPPGLTHANSIGVVRTVAVREGFENRGVGTALIKECINEVLEGNAEALCAVGWEQNGDINIGGLIQHFNFEAVGRYENYWREDSKEHGYHCNNCGEPPCECPATLFVRYC